MERIVLANWKANIPPDGAVKWLRVFLEAYTAKIDHEVVLAIPHLHLGLVLAELAGRGDIKLAAQGVSPYPAGSYTGATPASWLRGIADYALIGHRERRHYFHESSQEVAAQVRECVAVGIRPILCCTREEVGPQLAALESSELDQVILAFTPTDAERLETADSGQNIAKVVAEFRALSGGRPVLYGGGVHGSNCQELSSIDGVSGLMAGRASLDPVAFAEMLRQVSQ